MRGLYAPRGGPGVAAGPAGVQAAARLERAGHGWADGNAASGIDPIGDRTMLIMEILSDEIGMAKRNTQVVPTVPLALYEELLARSRGKSNPPIIP